MEIQREFQDKIDVNLLFEATTDLTEIEKECLKLCYLENLGKNGKDAVVIYSAKTQEDLVFKNELDDLAKTYKFKLIYMLSQEKKDGYLYGRLNGTEITRLVPDIQERDTYICGPHSLLHSLTHDFESLGIPKNQVHFEKFSF
jgi:ferredoxin-NADP reductase